MENDITKQLEGGYVRFTDLSAADFKGVFPLFSIKYVYKGFEYYKIESGEYKITDHELLYAAAQPGDVYFERKGDEQSIGLCVGIREDLILDAIKTVREGCFNSDPEANALDNSAFSSFLEGIYSKSSKKVSAVLGSVCEKVCNDHDLGAIVNDSWLFALIDQMILEEFPAYVSFNRFDVAKVSTRKELLKRLLTAKQFMDENFLSNPSISEIAKVGLLSEFHFFRTFKTAFGVSPYRYLLDKRLEYARTLILEAEHPIFKIATIARFSDQFAFSKAFKQKYRVSPAGFIKNGGNKPGR
jgi:AraC family transcriptional regulator